MDSKKYRFETLQIHAGLQPDEPTGARGVAIYPTAAYRFKNCDHAARLFELSEGGNIYTRLQNPTNDAVAAKIADYVIEIPEVCECLSPILTSVPLQLLAYYVAVNKGRNVDQPRNLAKSVTVE